MFDPNVGQSDDAGAVAALSSVFDGWDKPDPFHGAPFDVDVATVDVLRELHKYGYMLVPIPKDR